MTNFRRLSFPVFVLAGVLTSCLKEEKCPPEQSAVLVAVQDTNYDNAGEIQLAAAIDEELPFASYVGSLDILSKSVDNPANTFHQRVVPASQDRMVTLSFANHPAGRYEISVSGNTAAENYASETDYLLELHPTQTESGDIYLERDTTVLPPSAKHIIYLQRTKGKLLVLYSDFPEEITGMEVRASGVYKNVDGNKVYSGITQAVKSYQLPDLTGNGSMQFLLAPTAPDANPALQIILYDQNGDPIRIFSDIVLSIARNHITPLEIRYDPALDTWEIWIFVAGEWIQLHNLTIE